jgi:hypothetical protein
MRENEIAINAARSANERVATAIVKALHEQQTEAGGYSSRGGQNKADAKPPVSLQIDQRL